MKSKKLSLIIILLSILALVFILTFYKLFSLPINSDFADKIIFTDEYSGFATEIGQDDVSSLKEAFNGTAWKIGYGFPACPLTGISVTFSSEDHALTLYPAGDGCDTVRVRHKGLSYYYSLGEKNSEMREILEKYGAVWPYV